MTKLPNGAPSGVKVDAVPLFICGIVNVDLAQRCVTFPVRRRLDLSAQMVVLPFHLLKGLTAAIINQESNDEKAAIAAQAVAKQEIAEPAS